MILTCGVLLLAVAGGAAYQILMPTTNAALPAQADAAVGQTLDFGDSFTTGSPNAPVTVLEFSDFQCPFCRSFARTIQPTLRRELVATGKVRWVFKNFALEEIHPDASAAAVAAACGGEQGHFWEMHDLLFGVNLLPFVVEPLSADTFLRAASNLNLSMAGFERCLKQGDADERVRSDREAAEQIGIQGTPTFLLGITVGASRVEVADVIPGSLSAVDFRNAVNAVADKIAKRKELGRR